MRYLELYEQFRLIKESLGIQGKKLILLSGPSASGKTTFATLRGVVSWLDDKGVSADKILVGTDSIQHENSRPMISKILEKAGLPALSKVMKDFPDAFFNFDRHYKEKYEEWESMASEEEKEKYKGLKAAAGYAIKGEDKCPRCKGSINPEREDGRVAGMAWVAYLHPAKSVLFDDIDTAIKDNFYTGCKEWQLFTPLDWLLKNIASRNNDKDTSLHIDINDKGTAIDQYCKWYEATDKSDLDNKSYNSGSLIEMLKTAGHTNPEKVLSALGADGMNEFYIKRKEINKPDLVINTRDKSTGKAIDAPDSI